MLLNSGLILSIRKEENWQTIKIEWWHSRWMQDNYPQNSLEDKVAVVLSVEHKLITRRESQSVSQKLWFKINGRKS